MDVWMIFVLALVGLAGGLLSGLLGVGGAIVFVPGLVYGAGWDIREAVAASLVLAAFTALSGTLRGIRGENPLDWKVFALFSSVIAPGALVRVEISRNSPEVVIQLVFAALLILLSYPTARGGFGSTGAGRRVHPALVLVAGGGVGVLAGLVGIGGAALIVPLMSLGFGLGFKKAVSTSLGVNFFTGVAGGSGYLAADLIRLGSLPPLIIGSMAGAWAGVMLRERVPEAYLRRSFAVLMLLTAVRILADATGLA